MAPSKRTAVKTDLSEEDMEFILANTDFDREKILAWFAKFREQCPDAQMNREQFIEFYKKLIPGENDGEEEFCACVFETFDADDNGYVDFGTLIFCILQKFWISIFRTFEKIQVQKLRGLKVQKDPLFGKL